jgi:putative hydrolase of HD superfamily
VRAGVRAPESVAAHSWGVSFLVLVLCPPDLDRGRALAIATLHDLAEVRAGDITPHDGVPPEEKTRREAEAMRALIADLPGGDDLYTLWREYEDASSPEGRLVKALDKLDMALQAAAYAARDGLDPGEFVDSALDRLTDPLLRALAGDATA